MKKIVKKALLMLLCLMMIPCFCACGGNVKNVEIETVESELYSEKDINSAIQTIIKEFAKNWSGCTLTKIAYAGDERTLSESEYYADEYDADQIIVLVSSFEVGPNGGDGSIEPNSSHDDWSWILVRNNGGAWKHVDHGYG